jgi:AbrB family looped-hinge helix DNA binding protein
MAHIATVHNKRLYGTATVGTKGQIVIPASAREELNIESGDRLYVVGTPNGGILCLLKEESLEKIMQSLVDNIESIRTLKEENKE